MKGSRAQGLGFAWISKAEVEYLRAAVSETPRSDLQAGGEKLLSRAAFRN